MKKYFFDRLFTLEYLIASSGIAFSGLMINGGEFVIHNFLISFFGILLFFILLRLDDDIEDVSKDKIAFPNRVELKKFQLQEMEKIVWRITIIYSVFLFLFYWQIVFFYAAALIYFWIQKKPIRNPILEHLVNQGMIIPIALFASAMGQGASPSFACVLFGAFSTYEICRKLDPFAHPVMMSLLQFYGFNKVYWIVVAQILVSAIGAYFLNSYLILWPAEIGVLYILTRLYKTPREYRLAQIAAGISLLLHIWLSY